MLEGNRCELCKFKIETEKAQHKQTKYHDHCAREMKTRNSLSSWSPDQRKPYMREYMRRYRQDRKAKLSTKTVETPLQTDESFESTARTNTFMIAAPLMVVPILWPVVHHLSFDSVLNFIRHLQIFVLEVTALGVVATVAWQHLRQLWKKMNNVPLHACCDCSLLVSDNRGKRVT